MTCGCAGMRCRSRLSTTASHAPARKAAVVVFFPPLFSSLFLLPPCEMQPGARENRISVCFNGCSIPQVYPDLKIPVKWGASLTTGMMLMLIWVCYCFFCLRSSLCHLSLNSFSTDWHVCGNVSPWLIPFITWQHSIYGIRCIIRSFSGQTSNYTLMDSSNNKCMN